jgi:hypothetical protein
MSKGNWLLALVLIICAGCATQKSETASDENNSQKADFNYAQLQIKDLTEMQAVVNKQIKKADDFSKDNDEVSAVAALRSALQYVFSRPNSDNMVSALTPPLRSKLRELDAFEKVLDEIVDAAIYKLNDKHMKAGARATSYFVLENFMSECKPETQVNEKIKGIFAKIRDAKIELDGSVKSDLKMRAMYQSPKSPSDIAAKIIGGAKR